MRGSSTSLLFDIVGDGRDTRAAGLAVRLDGGLVRGIGAFRSWPRIQTDPVSFLVLLLAFGWGRFWEGDLDFARFNFERIPLMSLVVLPLDEVNLRV